MSTPTPTSTDTLPADNLLRTAFGPDVAHFDIEVLGSSIHWVEADSGRPIVFIHGNPTSSFVWRNVFNRLRGAGRLLAVDLIGFGLSGKPDIDYSLDDYERFLDAWFDALDLRDVTLVLQDYGSAFGIAWARRHPDRVRSIVFAEPVLRPIPSSEVDPDFITLRSQVLQSGVGEQIVLEENAFVEKLLPSALVNGLTAEEQEVYVAPFLTPQSRRPILVFPRALPIDGVPASTVEHLEPNARWLSESATPKLLLEFEPGFILTPEVSRWARENIANLEVKKLGHGIHWVQEDQPEAFAEAVTQWLSHT